MEKGNWANTHCARFDGRQIRVDKASDTGPRSGGRGGPGGYANSYGRGGYAGVPVAGAPGIAYGTQQPYGIQPNVYDQSYGRGYAPQAPAGYGIPPQGT